MKTTFCQVLPSEADLEYLKHSFVDTSRIIDPSLVTYYFIITI